MTISTTDVFERYDGDDSTTVFPIGFKWTDDAHIQVTLRDVNDVEVAWTQGTQYSLSGVGNDNGGTLSVIVDPIDYTPATGEVLLIELNVPNTQGVALPLGGEFPSPEVEKALDLLTQQVGQLIRDFERSFRVPTTDSQIGENTLYPIDTERAGKLLGFDANGKPAAVVTSPPTAVISTFWENILGFTTVLESQQALDLEVGVDVQPFSAQIAFLNLANNWTRQQRVVAVNKNALGTELVTNGGFDADTDWTKGTGWLITGGVASVDGTQTVDSDLEQDITIANGDTYEITFTISNYVAGTITPVIGDTLGTARSANGTFTETITAGAGVSPRLQLRANSDGDMDIDNVTVKAATVDWDLDLEQALNLTLDGGTITLRTPTNLKDGSTGNLKIIQDGVGGRQIVWPAIVDWSQTAGGEPPLTGAANAVDLFSWYCDGTNLLVSALGDFQ